MNPLLLFPIAIFTPVLLAATLFVPAYAGIYLSSYIIYGAGGGAHPLADQWLNVFYIIEVYGQLATYWYEHKQQLGMLDFALPVIGIPFIGAVLSIYFTYKLASAMLNVFHLTTGNS